MPGLRNSKLIISDRMAGHSSIIRIAHPLRLRSIRELHDMFPTDMGSISVACYKLKPGCDDALLQLVRSHLPPLRAEGLVTERAPIMTGGTII